MVSSTETAKAIEIQPAIWADFEALMGEKGGCGGCWCMLWRRTAKEMEAGKGEGNRQAMKALFDQGEAPGLSPRRARTSLAGSRLIAGPRFRVSPRRWYSSQWMNWMSGRFPVFYRQTVQAHGLLAQTSERGRGLGAQPRRSHCRRLPNRHAAPEISVGLCLDGVLGNVQTGRVCRGRPAIRHAADHEKGAWR